MKLSIVIPSYNEERTLATLLDRVLALDLAPALTEVIVVDDGSEDTTPEILKRYADQITVLTHPANRGKGAAVRSGFGKATGDYVVVQDADLEYNPEDFQLMLDAACRLDARAVYGSRVLGMEQFGNKHGRLHFFWGGLCLTWITNVLYGTRITDEPTCYKMIRRDVLNRITLTSEGFEFCPEITAKIARRGIVIHEVPIRYAPRSTSDGKKIRFRDGIIAIWTLLKYRF